MSSRDIHASYRWIMLGSGAVVREFFLPAFAHLNVLHNLAVVDLAIPSKLRQAYPQVEFIEEDFRCFLKAFCERGVVASIVAVPNKLHEEAVLRLLEFGAHVLCEKPLALSENACQRMRQAALAANRLLAVNMVRRLFPSIRIIRRIIADGQIGKLQKLLVEHGGVFHWPAQSLAPFLPENGGVFADMGVHYLDLAESLVGSLELRTYQDDSRGGVEAEAIAELVSASGVAVSVHVSRLRNLANTITLIGSQGRIVLNVNSILTFNLHSPPAEEGVEIRPLRPFACPEVPVSFLGCFVNQIQRFENRIAAGDMSVDEPEAAARNARLIEQAYCRRLEKPRPSVSSPLNLETGPTLITGATGFIGSHLVERLVTCGAEVTALVRRPQTCASVARSPVNLVSANLLDLDAIRKNVKGKRYVFHLAYGRDGTDASTITVQGTKNIVDASIEAQCEAVIILGTVNVLGWPKGEVDESFPYRPVGGSYGRTKAAMERWCLKRARDSGKTRIAVLLPSCVYGPGGPTFTELPARLASQNSFAWISDGGGIANYVFIDNLIDAMFLAASSPGAGGQRFIISDGWTTWRDFLNPIVAPWLSQIGSVEPGELARRYAQTRRGAFRRALEAAVSNADIRHEIKQTMLGALASRIAAKTGRLPRAQAAIRTSPTILTNGAPPEWLEDLFGNHKTRFSSAKVQADLGWTPRVTLPEGQRLSVEYLREIGLHPPCPEARISIIPGRAQR